jgi:phospholipid/cholesterol/gamma-HCH transport system substrate-binding protein
MTRSPTRDLTVGVFVLVGLAALAYLSVRIGGTSYSGPGGLILHAYFDEVGGLSARAPVVVGGVKVGRVSAVDLELDPESNQYFRARVTLDLDRRLALPRDTHASIQSQGLLGDNLLSLSPGGDTAQLRSGDVIEYTQNYVPIMSLVGKFISNLGDGK